MSDNITSGQTDATPSEEFERGVRAAAETMRLYFVDENDSPIYDISSSELEQHHQGAISDALNDEKTRIEHSLVSE